MMDEIETLKHAIETQKEIRNQLIDEISKIEYKMPQSRRTKGQLAFLQNTFKKSEEENKSLHQEIEEVRQKVIPNLTESIQIETSKCQIIQRKIQFYSEMQNNDLFDSYKNNQPQLQADVLNTLKQILIKEVDSLDTQLSDYQMEIAQYRTKIRTQEERQRKKAHDKWSDELAHEYCIHGVSMRRVKKVGKSRRRTISTSLAELMSSL